jgi:2,3-bisphosphoglycerate-independent phosphoglycerate mutase
MYATEHRCGIKVSGPNLSSDISGTDPLKDGLPIVKCEADDPNDQSA